eukprot:COSAG01_NODE_8668_length_2703_cov_4.591398_5_plen_76_part_00
MASPRDEAAAAPPPPPPPPVPMPPTDGGANRVSGALAATRMICHGGHRPRQRRQAGRQAGRSQAPHVRGKLPTPI